MATTLMMAAAAADPGPDPDPAAAPAIPAMRRGSSKGGPSLALLPTPALLAIVALLTSPGDRNNAALVCRALRACDRATRTALRLRCLRADIWFLPLCFPAVTHLDLTAVTILGAGPGPPRFFLHAAELHRLRAAFPRLQALRVPALPEAQLTAVAGLWPGLKRLEYTDPGGGGEGDGEGGRERPRLRHTLTVLRACEAVSAAYMACEGGLAAGVPPAGCPRLRELDAAGVLVTGDADLAAVAARCPRLERLCVAVRPGVAPGRGVTGSGFVALVRGCPALRSLSVCVVVSADDQAAGDNGAAEVVVRAVGAACGERGPPPGLELDLSLERAGGVPLPPPRTLAGAAGAGFSNLLTLVVMCTDADMAPLARTCPPGLRALTLGSCPGLRDPHLAALARRCSSSLRALRLLHCLNVTDAGVAASASACSGLASLSLCYLRPRLSALLAAVRAVSPTLTALRLMTDRAGADSLAGLSAGGGGKQGGGWPALTRLELTVTGAGAGFPGGAAALLHDPASWLAGCPRLRHLALMLPHRTGPAGLSLAFLRHCPSLTSLALCFSGGSDGGGRDGGGAAAEQAREIAEGLPRLQALSVHMASADWVAPETGRWLARCPALTSLHLQWADKGSAAAAAAAGSTPRLREFLVQLVATKRLRDVQLPYAPEDEDDLRTFYRAVHAQSVRSLVKCVRDLRRPPVAKAAAPAGGGGTAGGGVRVARQRPPAAGAGVPAGVVVGRGGGGLGVSDAAALAIAASWTSRRW